MDTASSSNYNNGSTEADRPVIQVRIVFAGGCHIVGYPLKPELGFPAVATAALQKQFQCEVSEVSPVSLVKPGPVLAECKRSSPDILVLQLGHYTSGIWLRKRFNKLMRRSKSSGDGVEETESSSSSVAMPSSPIDPWLPLRSLFRMAADRFLTLAGYPAYPLKDLASDLEAYFEQVRSLRIPLVFVLSPFPCLDTEVRRRRKAMYPCFAALSKKYGFHYVDVTAQLQPEMQKHNPLLYVDPLHLGPEGHRRVADSLTDAIAAHSRVLIAAHDTLRFC